MSIFKGLPEDTTHISTVEIYIGSSGRIDGSFRAFKQSKDGEWLYFHTDSYNEYSGWHPALPLYRDGVLPELHFIIGLKV